MDKATIAKLNRDIEDLISALKGIEKAVKGLTKVIKEGDGGRSSQSSAGKSGD
jgi:hypothetical protein